MSVKGIPFVPGAPNPFNIQDDPAAYMEWQRQQALANAGMDNADQRNARLNPNAPGNQAVGAAALQGALNGVQRGGGGNGLDPWTAAMLASGQWANAGANMWDASQNGLANIFQTGILADTQKALGEQALNNQAQLYANNLSLGNNQLSTLSQLGNAGYQNQIDRINALMKGLNPLLSGIGSGQAFSGLGTGIANMMGGASGSLGAGGPLGSGGLTGFQSSNGVTATLPGSGGGLGSYSTGIGTAPAMSTATAQAGLNQMAGQAPNTSVSTPNAQTTPAARQTLAGMMGSRGAAGGRQAATSLGNYEQAARAQLGYDQQAQNAQAANSLQQLMSGMYGQNLNRQLGYQQTNNSQRLARLGAGASLMGGALNAGTGLLGSVGGLLG